MPDLDSPLVLVVDDDAAVCWAVQRVLESAGLRVDLAADAAAARRRLKSDVAMVLTDIRMPGGDGLDLLAAIHEARPGLPVVVMTAHGTVETAMAAVARGAFDYLPKPLDLDRTLAVVRRALGETPLAASARPAADFDADGIVGGSPPMQEVYRRLAAAAGNRVEVLFSGPAGSGKEALARTLHRHGVQREGPFVHLGCAALAEADAAAELAARLAQAAGGSLFLDDVDGLPVPGQAALAAALAGSPPARVLSATRRDLPRLAVDGRFRDDLAFRLRAVHITVPPLTARLDDLPALVRAFLTRAAGRLGRQVAITDAAMRRLAAHPWPGNVRELMHVVEEAAVLAVGGVVDSEHLPLPAGDEASGQAGFAAAAAVLAHRLFASDPGAVHARAVDELEAALVREALARTGGNQLRAAELLGINRATFRKRMLEAGVAR